MCCALLDAESHQTHGETGTSANSSSLKHAHIRAPTHARMHLCRSASCTHSLLGTGFRRACTKRAQPNKRTNSLSPKQRIPHLYGGTPPPTVVTMSTGMPASVDTNWSSVYTASGQSTTTPAVALADLPFASVTWYRNLSAAPVRLQYRLFGVYFTCRPTWSMAPSVPCFGPVPFTIEILRGAAPPDTLNCTHTGFGAAVYASTFLAAGCLGFGEGFGEGFGFGLGEGLGGLGLGEGLGGRGDVEGLGLGERLGWWCGLKGLFGHGKLPGGDLQGRVTAPRTHKYTNSGQGNSMRARCLMNPPETQEQ